MGKAIPNRPRAGEADPAMAFCFEQLLGLTFPHKVRCHWTVGCPNATYIISLRTQHLLPEDGRHGLGRPGLQSSDPGCRIPEGGPNPDSSGGAGTRADCDSVALYFSLPAPPPFSCCFLSSLYFVVVGEVLVGGVNRTSAAGCRLKEERGCRVNLAVYPLSSPCPWGRAASAPRSALTS